MPTLGSGRNAIEYRYTPLPPQWPGRQRPIGYSPKKSPFRLVWGNTERLLAAELNHLGAKEVAIALDLRNPGFFRQDGGIRADARPQSPAVIITFKDRDGYREQFPCDTFSFWQDNVHAIALALEALRKVDRYEVTRGDEQYVGFRALPPSGGSSAPRVMTEEEAGEILELWSDLPARLIITESSVARVAIRTAKGRAHPDAHGELGDFERVTEAANLVGGLHGMEV